MEKTTYLLLQAEIKVRWRRLLEWLTKGYGTRSDFKLAPSRLLLAALLIIGSIVLLLIQWFVFVYLIKQADLSLSGQLVILLLANGLIFLSIFSRKLIKISDKIFGPKNFAIEYLLPGRGARHLLIATSIIYLIPGLVRGFISVIFLMITSRLVLMTKPEQQILIGILGFDLVLFAIALKTLTIYTIGRFLNRPHVKRAALNSLVKLIGRIAFIFICALIISQIIQILAAQVISVGWKQALRFIFNQVEARGFLLTSFISGSKLRIIWVSLFLFSLIALITWVISLLIDREVELRRVHSPGRHPEYEIFEDRIVKKMLSHIKRLQSALPIKAIAIKDILLCLRQPQSLTRIAAGPAVVYAIAAGLGSGLLASDLVAAYIQPFHIMLVAALISVVTIIRSLMPTFAIDAEGANIDLLGTISVSSKDIIIAKVLSLGIVVITVNGLLGISIGVFLRTPALGIIYFLIVILLVSIALSTIIISFTAWFPRFDWREPNEAGSSLPSLLLGQLAQQTYLFFVLMVYSAPVVKQLPPINNANSSYPWTLSLVIVIIVTAITVVATILFASDRLAVFLDSDK